MSLCLPDRANVTVPTTSAPIRVFETYGSYERFLPLIYDEYMGIFCSLCYDYIQDETAESAVADHICYRFRMADTGLYEAYGDDYGIDASVGSVEVTYYENNYMGYLGPWWDFQYTTYPYCNDHSSDSVVECQIPAMDGIYDGCAFEGESCATDLDCCHKAFCSPVWGNCTDPVMFCRLLPLTSVILLGLLAKLRFFQ